MRVALIAIEGQPCATGSDAPLQVAGRTLALRQLDFALAAGAQRVIGLGHAASRATVELRLATEAAGAKFQVASEAHALLGTVGTADDLLVLAPGLLPEAEPALSALETGHGVLTFPEAAVAQGFERIDRDRAWAGVARVPGNLIERLADLPGDIAIPEALMRLALQARIPERRLDAALLADGAWALLAAEDGAIEGAWLKRNLPPVPPASPAAGFAGAFLRPLALPVLRKPRALAWAGGTTLGLLALALGTAVSGFPGLSFLLLAAGATAAAFTNGAAHLRAAPYAAADDGLPRMLAWLGDLALLICAALSVSGALSHRIFPAAVLLLALHLPLALPQPLRWLDDRLAVALILACGALVGGAEIVLMAMALLLLALRIGHSRITRI